MSAKAKLEAAKGDYIPNEIYVGFQPQGLDAIVGWMHPNLDDEETMQKRKASMDSWVKDASQNRVIKNEFQSGFAMIRQVSRGSSFSDATYWRVFHPDGFEFEIALDNFEYILERYILDKGVITNGKFKLVTHKRKWTLVDESHPEYTKAQTRLVPFSPEMKQLEADAAAELKAAKAALAIGDSVYLNNKSGKHTFLGSMSCAVSHKHVHAEVDYKRYKVFRRHSPKSKYNQESYDYVFLTTVNVDPKYTKTEEVMTPEDGINEVMSVLETGKFRGAPAGIDRWMNFWVSGVFLKKPKKTELVLHPLIISKDVIIDGQSPKHSHNTKYYEWPRGVSFQRKQLDTYDRQPCNLVARDKLTGNIVLVYSPSNQYFHFGSIQHNPDHGTFAMDVEGVDRHVICAYHDPITKLKHWHDSQKRTYTNRLTANPLDGMAMKMLKQLDDDLAENTAKEINAKPVGWYDSEQYELFYVTRK